MGGDGLGDLAGALRLPVPVVSGFVCRLLRSRCRVLLRGLVAKFFSELFMPITLSLAAINNGHNNMDY